MGLDGMSFSFTKFPTTESRDMHISYDEMLIFKEHNEEIEKLILEMQNVLNRTNVRYAVSKFRWHTRIYISKKVVPKVDRDLFFKLLMIEKKQKKTLKESCERLKSLQKGD